MHDELLQFKLLNVWTLVDLPNDKWAIGTKWVFRNKKDERGIVVKNKARLVTSGHTLKEGIDYDELFAIVARIEVIRLFLAYASVKDFVVYQMDVKSAFLYGKIEKEVYVCQPPGFEEPDFPNKVYKGIIDKTLFIKRHKDDILLVQVYVDNIIFGSTKKELSTEFEKLMHDKFQMSSVGELCLFLGLQVQQKSDGIFISQDKYVADMFKKFDFSTVKTTSTLIEPNKALIKDAEAEEVDVHVYRSMIGSLIYLTASRPNITFVVYACVRFQVTPKSSHLHDVMRIFRYLKGQPKLRLWYPKDSPFDLEAYSNSEYAGASLDRKSTIGGFQFLSKMLISWQCKKQTIVANSITEVEYVVVANCCGQVLWIQNQTLDYGFNFLNTKIYIDNESTICIIKNPVFHSKTKYIEIRLMIVKDGRCFMDKFEVKTDKTVYKEWEDTMERAATTASSLEEEQDNGNINRTQSMATLNEPFPYGTSLGSGPRASKGYTGVDIPLFPTMLVQGLQGEGSTVPIESHHIPSGDPTISQPPLSSPSRVPTLPHDSPLPRGHTPRSDEGSMTLNELMVLYTTFSNKVESLETELKLTKQTYGTAFTKLIKKVKKLEKTVKTSQAKRRAKIMISDDDMVSENSSNQGRMTKDIDQDAGVHADITKVHTYSKRRRAVSTGSGGVSTASRIISIAEEIVSTAGVSMPVSTTDMVQESTSSPKATKIKLKKLYFKEIKELFEAIMERIQDFVPMEIKDDKEVFKFAGAGGSKRDVEEELDQGSSKKQKTDEASRLVQEQQLKKKKNYHKRIYSS
uniref:Putative ribonuclease H-like domain-containing protein n=1 Tax=Tanacetum cinerariifolium TaxID=118510 RepID=A0A6L2NPA3_TANCI|nr:putative ribonuclease H-like domain-containing protein [Tanacetum cinerariifolium]